MANLNSHVFIDLIKSIYVNNAQINSNPRNFKTDTAARDNGQKRHEVLTLNADDGMKVRRPETRKLKQRKMISSD